MLVSFAVVMGVGYGGFIALAPAVTAGLFGTVGLGASSARCTPPPDSADSSARRSSGVVIDGASYEAGIVLSMAVAAAAATVLRMLPAGHR